MKIITVAAAIILNDQQQLLVVRKRHTSCFMQVGGKLEPNEPPEQTMLREIQEEIGCQASIEQFVGRFETATANEPDHLADLPVTQSDTVHGLTNCPGNQQRQKVGSN